MESFPPQSYSPSRSTTSPRWTHAQLYILDTAARDARNPAWSPTYANMEEGRLVVFGLPQPNFRSTTPTLASEAEEARSVNNIVFKNALT